MASTAIVITAFQPNSDKYKCCCRSTLCTTGLKVLFVLQIVYIVINLLSLIGGVYATSIFDIILASGVAVCLYMALRTEKHTWLVAPLVVAGVALVVYVIAALMVLCCAAVGSELYRESLIEADPRYREVFASLDLRTFAFVATVALVGLALVQIWLLTVVKGAYDFYQDQASYRVVAALTHAQHAAAGAPPPPYYSTFAHK